MFPPSADVPLAGLTRDNAVILFVDQQVGWYTAVARRPLDADHNLLRLARVAQHLGIPAILTANREGGVWGPTLPELRAVLSGQEVIDRPQLNAWDDRRVREAVVATSRRQVLIAGHGLCVCAMLPAASLLADGFVPSVIVDGCVEVPGNLSLLLTEIIRVAQAGITVVNTAPLLLALTGKHEFRRGLPGLGSARPIPAMLLARGYGAPLSRVPCPSR
jgi:hypothetical protein